MVTNNYSHYARVLESELAFLNDHQLMHVINGIAATTEWNSLSVVERLVHIRNLVIESGRWTGPGPVEEDAAAE